jgi:hypothetical protein
MGELKRYANSFIEAAVRRVRGTRASVVNAWPANCFLDDPGQKLAHR